MRATPEFSVCGEVRPQGSGVPCVLNLCFSHIHFEPWGVSDGSSALQQKGPAEEVACFCR